MAGKWFSAALNAVQSLQPKGNKEQMLNTLRKQPGVKKEEMDFLGLDEVFDGQNIVTVDQLQRAIRDRFDQAGMMVNSDHGFYIPNANPANNIPGLEVNRREAGGLGEFNTSYGSYSMATEDFPKINPSTSMQHLVENRYVERIPQAGTSQHSYDYDASAGHFPNSDEAINNRNQRLNIGHSRGFSGDIETAEGELADAFIVDEVQSDLMQAIYSQNKDLRIREEQLASEVSQPDLSVAISERWKDPDKRTFESMSVLEELLKDGTLEVVDQPEGNIEIISAITGRSLGFGPEADAMMQARQFVSSAMVPRSPISDDIVSLFADGWKDKQPFERILGDIEDSAGPLDQVIAEQEDLARFRENLPYQKSWPELVLKDALQEAVDRDAPYFAWVDGARQADRYGPEEGRWEGLSAFYDVRLPNSKLWKELGLEKPKPGSVMPKGSFPQTNAPSNSWFVKLPDEVKEKIRNNGLPLFSLGALATYGPYQNQGALYEQGR